MAVGDEPSHQMEDEVERAAMTRVLDLADVLELVHDRFDNRPFAQEKLITQRQQPVAHILAQLGDQPQSMLHEERFGQGLRDVAFVGEELAKEATDEAGQRGAVVGVAWRETKGQQFAAIVDHQMQFEAVEPAHRGLATTSVDLKDTMLVNARVMTDGQCGGVDEADAGALTQLGVQVDGQRREHPRQELDEAGVAHEPRELATQVDLDVLGVGRRL